MPVRASRICPHCRQAFTGRRCPECADRFATSYTARNPRTGPSPWDSPVWRAASRDYLDTHPYCECEKHRDLPEHRRPRATITDHRDGLGPTGPRGLDPTNFQALTRPCHNAKTNRHDGGWGNPVRRMM